MIRFALKRLLAATLTLVVIAVVTFLLLRVAPGGPFDDDRPLPPDVQAEMEARYGLRDPWPVQLARYLGGLARGDLGPSFKYKGRTVNEVIAAGAPASAAIGLLALELCAVAGIAAGALAAAKRDAAADRAVRAISSFFTAVPSFLVAVVLAAIFCLWLRWLPIGGAAGPAQVILPAIALAAPHAAAIARLTRASLLETLEQDFVRTARAKGVPERAVVLRHALPPALAPVVQYLGPAAAGLVTGSLAVEAVFNVPGLGAHFVNAALNRDYTLVLGTALLYSAILLVFNGAADVAAAWLDPRTIRRA